MLTSRVNWFVPAFALVAACTSANSSTRGAESTTATSPAPAVAVDTAKLKDPEIARADSARIAGSPSAKTWVIIASDFQCPYCKEWHDESFATFRREYVQTGKVRFAYVNYPLRAHQNAWPSAEAAMCAAAQNKFWEMHDALFATQQEWEVMPDPHAVFDSLAHSLSLDVTRWTSCVASQKMRPLIEADHDRALAAGVTQTPSFIVGNHLVIGAVPIEEMRRAVDAALATPGTASH